MTIFSYHKKDGPLELLCRRPVERPVAQALCLNGGKEEKTIRQIRTTRYY
ncbi:MAG: hypothetical protein P8185_04545 [Deltaproteobacteria bacterium]